MKKLIPMLLLLAACGAEDDYEDYGYDETWDEGWGGIYLTWVGGLRGGIALGSLSPTADATGEPILDVFE